MVPPAGLEPARPYGQGILSPQRLPFRHEGGHGREFRGLLRLGQGVVTPDAGVGWPKRRLRVSAALGHRAGVKIGFMGGSFDPVHFGHLIAAQDAYEQYQLDRLILVPAAQAPLKPEEVKSAPGDRLAMLKAAVEWDHRFELSDFELQKGGTSYTIDSARHFRALYPNNRLFWIIGGDQLP